MYSAKIVSDHDCYELGNVPSYFSNYYFGIIDYTVGLSRVRRDVLYVICDGDKMVGTVLDGWFEEVR